MCRRGVGHWTLWFSTLASLCVLAVWRVDPAGPIETDVLALLPERHDSRVLERAEARGHEAFSRQLLAMVTGRDNSRTREATLAARQALLAPGLTESAGRGQVGKALALYRQHGFALLSPAQVARFQRNGARTLAMDVAVSLASPAGMVNLGMDPGGYVARFVSHLPRPYPDFLPDGPLLATTRGDQRVFLLRMRLPSDGFGADGASLAARAVHQASHIVASVCGACRFRATGAALFAHAAQQQAHRETLVLSITSTSLIMVLIAWAYRSLAPHLLGFLQLGASVVVAAAAVIAVFGSIHILTLVFGTTLLGIAIDYAFLYFSEYWFGESAPQEVLRKVRSGLGMGLATGVLAFAFLALTGFPAMSQMAVFSIAGLVEAALVVALIFPVTLRRVPRVRAHPLVRWPARFMAAARRPSRWRWLLPLLALVLAAPGWWQLEAQDSVRELSHIASELAHTDQVIRTTLGRFPSSGFFLIQGDDMAQALAREEALFQHISERLPQASPLGFSQFLPSPAQQQASLAAWKEILGSVQALKQAFVASGLPAALATHIASAWRAAEKAPLNAETLLQAVPALKHFVIPGNGGVALMATVFGRQGIANDILTKAASGVQGVRYVQPLERIDRTFARIRVRATWLVVLGYLLISAVLIWRYGWREALRMLWPPLLALAVTLGALGWLGVPLNVFSVVALILILGLGRDYAVFLREVGARQRAPALAVLLSALTTVIGFGLLTFSRIPALHAFGLVTGIGILASWLVTPLSLPTIAEDGQPTEESYS
ncbi:MAG: MMPL family transporter [Nitrococcus sp.]|nr:MMPL family transporter [Nitrococcus sp.]